MEIENTLKDIKNYLEKDKYFYKWKVDINKGIYYITAIDNLLTKSILLTIVLDERLNDSIGFYTYNVDAYNINDRKKQEIIYELSRLVPEGCGCAFNENNFILSTLHYKLSDTNSFVKGLEQLIDTIKSDKFTKVCKRYF